MEVAERCSPMLNRAEGTEGQAEAEDSEAFFTGLWDV